MFASWQVGAARTRPPVQVFASSQVAEFLTQAMREQREPEGVARLRQEREQASFDTEALHVVLAGGAEKLAAWNTVRRSSMANVPLHKASHSRPSTAPESPHRLEAENRLPWPSEACPPSPIPPSGA